MGPEGGGCKELPSGGVPWAADTVILALAEREDIMVVWGNHVGVSEIARPCRPISGAWSWWPGRTGSGTGSPGCGSRAAP